MSLRESNTQILKSDDAYDSNNCTSGYVSNINIANNHPLFSSNIFKVDQLKHDGRCAAYFTHVKYHTAF
jgi:hypothetical protein